GSKPYVVILVRFADKPATPNPVSYYQNLMSNNAGGMDNYWRELSFNLINLTGTTVVGWYNLPQNMAYYQTNSPSAFHWDKMLHDATTFADPDVFFPEFYGMNILLNDNPGNAACGGGSWLTLDGATRGWGITIDPLWGHNLATLGHEMGHSLGFDRSSG